MDTLQMAIAILRAAAELIEDSTSGEWYSCLAIIQARYNLFGDFEEHEAEYIAKVEFANDHKKNERGHFWDLYRDHGHTLPNSQILRAAALRLTANRLENSK